MFTLNVFDVLVELKATSTKFTPLLTRYLDLSCTLKEEMEWSSLVVTRDGERIVSYTASDETTVAGGENNLIVQGSISSRSVANKDRTN